MAMPDADYGHTGQGVEIPFARAVDEENAFAFRESERLPCIGAHDVRHGWFQVNERENHYI
jgi:hypothetical protein